MVPSADIVVFLLTVGFISLSGVLMPGPVFAASIVKGAERKHAGAWIALGHLLVEIPLMLLIAAGLYFVFLDVRVKIGIGLIGGALLLYLGVRMVQMRGREDAVKKAFPYHPFVAGVITTITNPYFLVWWATVGASLIIWGLSFGWVGIVSMVVVHESCDLGWDYFVADTSYRSRKLWTDKIRRYVFGFCGLMLIVFGMYFMFAFWL